MGRPASPEGYHTAFRRSVARGWGVICSLFLAYGPGGGGGAWPIGGTLPAGSQSTTCCVALDAVWRGTACTRLGDDPELAEHSPMPAVSV